MGDPNQGPALASPPENSNTADETIDLTTSAAAAAAGGEPPHGGGPRLVLNPYDPSRPREYIRGIVTVGLLAMLGWVIVWSCFEAASWKDHWAQTKEMLQIILPALTGLIGSVIGFYFGSGVNSTSTSSGTGSTAANKIV